MRERLVVLLVCLVTLIVTASFKDIHSYPKDYFRSPLDVPLVLSGTFGELRTNHFHAGIDIKTQGREGLKIYAAADGYVSRIVESPWGYGKALYISHPNGLMTVYAHLQHFVSPIEDYAENAQYEKEEYAIDLYLKPGEIPVKKGQVIALSGNSGGSGAPHLHFEIRDDRTQEPLNPLFFGFDVKDDHQPLILGFSVHALGPLRNFREAAFFNIERQGPGQYTLHDKLLEVNARQVGFNIKAYDQLNGASNYNGVYSVALIAGGDTLHRFRMDRLSFDETRYLNAHIDYAAQVEKGSFYNRCYMQPGNKLSIYDKMKDAGILTLQDDSTHHVQIIVADAYGNQSALSFKIRYKPDSRFFENDPQTYTCTFPYNQDNQFYETGLRMIIPKGALYDTLYFVYDKKESTGQGLYSDIHKVHYPTVPAHKHFYISVKPEGVPPHLREKALIVYRPRASRQWEGDGGNWINDFITTRTRAFGEYAIMIDTVPPEIRPLNIHPGKDISGQSTIKLRITDDLAGIHNYRATIDGQWALMEYDAKNDLLIHYIRNELKQGAHEFVLEVSDERGNNSIYKANIKR